MQEEKEISALDLQYSRREAHRPDVQQHSQSQTAVMRPLLPARMPVGPQMRNSGISARRTARLQVGNQPSAALQQLMALAQQHRMKTPQEPKDIEMSSPSSAVPL